MQIAQQEAQKAAIDLQVKAQTEAGLAKPSQAYLEAN
jgi:hypothetical protein